MESNWASRSGWLVPSRVLLLACRLKPRRRSSRPTGLRLHRRLASPARAADAAAEVVPPAAQFGQAAADGAPRDTGRRRHCRYAAAACRPRLAGREQAPPPFVQEWRHRLEACSDARDINHPSSLDTPRSQSHRCPAPSLGLLAHPIPPRIDSVVRAQALTTPSAMTLALRDDTSRHDAGRSLYGRSTARLPTGPASWPTRQGTCPIMVLRAQGGRWLLPTSWPAWPAYNPSLPDACRGYRWPAWVASSCQRRSRRRSAASSGSIFLSGCRSIPGTSPATSQADWLISRTAIRVQSGLRTVWDRL